MNNNLSVIYKISSIPTSEMSKHEKMLTDDWWDGIYNRYCF
jgi:hypothetical protein